METISTVKRLLIYLVLTLCFASPLLAAIGGPLSPEEQAKGGLFIIGMVLFITAVVVYLRAVFLSKSQKVLGMIILIGAEVVIIWGIFFR